MTIAWQPLALSLLRLMSGLLLTQHGLVKLFNWPIRYSGTVTQFNLYWFAGAIELACGALIALGLLTRPAAFIASGFTAVAYFLSHYPRGFYPIANGGGFAVLYCFVFLYLFVAGGGPASLDALLGRRR